MSTDPVLLDEPRPGVRRITLNRPERLNAISLPLVEGVHAALERIDADRSARVVVLTGSGRGFCAGADLKGGGWAGEDGNASVVEQYRQQVWLSELTLRLHELAVPVVAAVNGPAVGGGLALALAADVRYASSTASFAVANIRIGLTGGEMGISYLLPRTVGRGKAAEMMLTGRPVAAEEALACRLVERVVAPEELEGAVAELTDAICSNAPFGVHLTKEMLALGDDAPSLRHAVVIDNRSQQVAAWKGDVLEAMSAFREGRPPRFTY